MFPNGQSLLDAEHWAEVAIVSQVVVDVPPLANGMAHIDDPTELVASPAPGHKCARCWRILPEVGRTEAHPTLCLRCTDAVDAVPAP